MHSGVDGDTPVIMDEEGTTVNVTDGMERVALSVHRVHKQKTAYEILRSDWSSDVCSSDPLVSTEIHRL